MNNTTSISLPSGFNKTYTNNALLFSPKVGKIRAGFERIMQCIGIIDKTETERALIFNDYLKELGLSIDGTYGKMLDVGAGDGDFAYFAQKHKTFPNTQIKSIDIEPDFVRNGKKSGVDIEVMDATHLRFPDELFDTIISHASMPHCLLDFDFRLDKQIPDPKGEEKVEQWIRETVRVLKNGGELRFRCPSQESGDYRGEIISKVVKQMAGTDFSYTTLPNSSEPTKKGSTTYILKRVSQKNSPK